MAISGDGVGMGDPLAFSKAKQSALLGHALLNRLFFLQVRNHLDPGWFDEVGNQKLWALLEGFYDKAGRFPLAPDELLGSRGYQDEDPQIKNLISAAATIAMGRTPDFGVDLLTKEFSLWAKAVILEEHIKKTGAAFNQKRPEDAIEIYRAGYKSIERADFLNAQSEEWDLDMFIERQRNDLENGVTFGLPQLDAKLNPSAPNGALLRGDTTVVLAPSNVGKTTNLVTVAAHNINRGKSVLFLTHEGRPEDIKFKILQCILQVTREEYLYRYHEFKAFQRLANYCAGQIRDNLTYIAHNNAFANIREVEAVIRQHQEMRKLGHGRGYDLLVDDYPALLYTDGLASGQLQKRISDEQVYGCFVSMALENEFHSLLAIQTNREGSKVNRGMGSNQRLLTMEDVMESWGVMTKATNVITINRSPYDKNQNRVTFYLCKSRSSETDWAFTCKSDYSRSTTHAPAGWPRVSEGFTVVDGSEPDPSVNMATYGCTAYQGTEPTSEKLNAIIDEYRNRVIPNDQLQDAIRGTFTPNSGFGRQKG